VEPFAGVFAQDQSLYGSRAVAEKGLFLVPGFPESIGPFAGQGMISEAGIGDAESTAGFGHGFQIMIRERLRVLVLQGLQEEAYA